LGLKDRHVDILGDAAVLVQKKLLGHLRLLEVGRDADVTVTTVATSAAVERSRGRTAAAAAATGEAAIAAVA
jgi:hypothetical protein